MQRGQIHRGLELPMETFDPEGRGKYINIPGCSSVLPSLTVHCESRRRRLRSPIVAMALETLVASHPCRLGDFSYVTIKTGENY